MEFLLIFIGVLSFDLYVLAADDNPDNIPPQVSRMPACDDLVKILRGKTIQAPKQTYTLGGLLGEGARSCVLEGETGWAFKTSWAIKIAPFQVDYHMFLLTI
ncbi:hypothetical protein Ddc_19178 [Ditylenchus destructor]|nr:hypothetical protein Ddc_19178 [Ditylenchus destructor]